jgi:RNA polymerase sigma factor (TIGR02999 family)
MANKEVDEYFPLVYDEVRTIARNFKLKYSADQTLQTTEIAHEAYIKLRNNENLIINNETHIKSLAAKAIRFILVDYIRNKRSLKKNGGSKPLDLVDLSIDIPDQIEDNILQIDDVLAELSKIDEKRCKLVECRFFAGYTIEETAVIMNTSTATVKRSWQVTKAWLYQQIKNQ